MSFFKSKPATSSQSSLSENTNNALITGTYTPAMQTGAGAISKLGTLLGVGGDAQQGYANYLQKAGFAPAMQQLSQQITGQGAASGLLNSGATSQALVREGTNLNNQYYNNYLQQLSGLAGLGNQAGSLIANTGQKSTSSGSSTGERESGFQTMGKVASTVGTLLSFSDPRLKADVRKIGQYPDGLGIYAFRYLTTAKRVIGVMADEVAKIRPHALGPKINGFATVNYGAL